MHRAPLRLGLLLAALALVLTPHRAHAGGSILLFSQGVALWETAADGTPEPSPATLFALGDRIEIVGVVTTLTGAFPGAVDTSATECTVVLSGGVVVSRADFFPWVVANIGDSWRIRVFADSRSTGTPAVTGIDPPNGSVPSTFADGELLLEGRISNGVLSWDVASGQGNFSSGSISWDGGSLLPRLIAEQPGTWYELDGVLQAAGAPAGYVATGIADLYSVTGLPVKATSWGGIKALYR